MNLVEWFQNAITGVYTPSVGMYDTSIGLPMGTPITSPVNGVIIGGDYLPGGLYGAYGQQAWGGELDILTNLQGFGDKVVVDILHFDTIAPNIVPGTIVSQGQYLGTSGGQTSGGNWPSLPKYSTGPHIGVGVRSASGFTPAWDAAPLIYALRGGTVQSSVPQGYGVAGSSSSSGSNGTGLGSASGIGGIGGDIVTGIGSAVGGLAGGLLKGWNPATLAAGIEQDVVGFSERAGLVMLGALLVLGGVIIFFFSRPEVQEGEEYIAGMPASASPKTSPKTSQSPPQGAASPGEAGGEAGQEAAQAAPEIAAAAA